MTPATSPSEEKELSLVNKLELRIALATEDAKLEALLKTYLAPLLLKLKSPHFVVVQKTVEVSQHINRRLQSTNIQLPVLALIQQLKEHGEDSKTLRVVNSGYIRIGISRISSKQELLEILSGGVLKDISASLSPPSPTGALLLYFTFQILPLTEFPRRGDPSNEGYREKLHITHQDASSLTKWFGKVLLLPYDQSTREAGSQFLSKEDFDYLTVTEINQAWNARSPLGLSIAKTKAILLDFIDTGAFTENERLLVYLFAGPETNPSGISDRGARFVKVAKIGNDDEKTVESLYTAYNSHATSTPITLRTRILTLLSRSQKITGFSSEAGQILRGQLESKEAGLLGQRFNSAFVAYIVHAFRLMDRAFRKESAASLISTLKDFVVNMQGWPKPDPTSDLQIRGQAYRLIGVAAQEGEVLDLELLDFLFSSLNEDNSGRETTPFVEEALSALTQAFSKVPLSPDMMNSLELWLETAAQSLLPKPARRASKVNHKSYAFILSRIANRCLPYSSVSARYVNIAVLAALQQTYEAKEEASIGLNPYLFRTNNSHRPDLWYESSGLETLKMLEPDCCNFLWPSFERLARTLFQGIEQDEYRVEEEEETFETLKLQWVQSPTAFLISLRYLYRNFLMETVASNPANHGKFAVSESWEAQMDLSLEQPLWQKRGMQAKTPQPTRLLFASLTAFAVTHSQEALDGQKIFACLLRSGFEPSHLSFTSLSIATLIPAIESKSQDTRRVAAQCFGVLYSDLLLSESHMEYQRSHKSTTQSMDSTFSGWIEERSSSTEGWGGFLALSQSLCRISNHYSAERSAAERFPTAKFFSSLFGRLATESNPEGLDSAAECVGLLGSWGVFGRILKFPVPGVETNGTPFKANDVVAKLKTMAKSGDETAILNIGKFSLWLDEKADAAILQSIYETLESCHELKQTEAQFTVGNALSYLAFSNSGDVTLSGTEAVALPDRETLTHDILTTTIKNCLQPKPSLKRSATIWLLCLVERGIAEKLQKYLPDCQKAFAASLSNRDVLTREAAGKGLNLLFEKGNSEIQEKLIQEFTETFTGSKAGVLSGAVTETTELFDEGTLRTDTGSVNTYKDILDLASEMGNPGLVYQFMSLAADSAIWTSRVALANGLSSDLTAKLERQMLENKNFFPVLYRYRFDSNPTVRRSMQTLWKSFAKKPSEVFDMHFDAIMQDLLKNILSKLWRWRETSCRALSELIQDQKFERYQKYLEDIWRSCAKVMDDIKSSVRAAALDLAKTLTNALVRKLESKDSSKEAVTMVNLIVPFLLSPIMIEASADEVKLWAITTLLKIVKESRGTVIEFQAPQLLQAFLDLFTALESGQVNWLHLNADKYNIDPADIDKARVTGTVRDNPIMRAVEKLVDNVYQDPSTNEKLVAVLETCSKTSIGLPTLAATSHIIVTMMLRYHARYKDYSDRLLVSTRRPLLDRNPTVQGYFAYAIGYISRWASDQQIVEIADYSWNLYRESTNTSLRTTAGEVFHAIAKHAPEAFSRLSSKMLPYVFIGKHDDEQDVKETFEKAWEESAGGQRAILLHLETTVKLASVLLDENKWTLKHAGARAIAEATDAVTSLGELVSPLEAPRVWPALEKALGGRSWEGKEVVLKAFVTFVEKVHGFWEKDDKLASQMNKIMFREARRQNRQYQAHSYAALANYATARKDLDLSEAILETITLTVEELASYDEDAMDVDDDRTKVNDGDRDTILIGAMEAAREGLYSPFAVSSSDHFSNVMLHLDILKQANLSHSRSVSVGLLESLANRIFPDLVNSTTLKITAGQKKKLTEILTELLFQSSYNGFSEDGRLQRSRAISALADVGPAFRDVAKEAILGNGRLTEVVELERIPHIREELLIAGRKLE